MTRVFLMHSWRTRWRALVVLALMIGLTGAVVFAAVAGARRSASALDRFHDAGQTLDVFLSADVTTPEPPALLDLLDGPLVESTNDLAFLFVDVDERRRDLRTDIATRARRRTRRAAGWPPGRSRRTRRGDAAGGRGQATSTSASAICSRPGR